MIDLREILGGKEHLTLITGTVVLNVLTHLQERPEKGKKHPAGVHEVWCGAGQSL